MNYSNIDDIRCELESLKKSYSEIKDVNSIIGCYIYSKICKLEKQIELLENKNDRG